MTNGASFASAFSRRRVLITGASGYVAGALTEKLLRADCQLVRISRRPLTPLHGSQDIVGNIGERSVWRDLFKNNLDVVFHLAGETSAYVAERDPEASLAANVLPIIYAIEAAHTTPVPPMLVIAGTATQVGLTQALPVNESLPDNPVTVYDLHKLFAEKHLLLAAQRGSIRGCCLRLANVYGPGPNENGSSDRGILNKMIRLALNGKPLTVFGEGELLRDHVYIDDVVEAFLATAAHPGATNGQTFIVGSGCGTTLKDAFSLAALRAGEITGQMVDVTSVPWPAGMSAIEFRNFIADVSALSNATGWHPLVSLSVGIDKTISAYRGSEINEGEARV